MRSEQQRTGHRDIIVVGGSVGSLVAIRAILRCLPAGFPASVFVVVHRPADAPDQLSEILDLDCALPVRIAQEGPFSIGHVYTAPPDRHLLLGAKATLQLGTGPRENMARPAIDPLFRSAALLYGARVIGVLLSGLLNDGASGMASIKRCGGVTVVQAPSDSLAPSMPLSALESVAIDYQAPADGLASTLVQLTQEAVSTTIAPAQPDLVLEVEIAVGLATNARQIASMAKPIPMSCPTCGGSLSEVDDQLPLRYRCQIGHGFTAQMLAEQQQQKVYEAMAVAMRTLEERSILNERMARDARNKGNGNLAATLEKRALEYRDHASEIRKALLAKR